MGKQFLIEVTRTSSSTKMFKVEAEDIGGARDKALDNAGSYEFSEHDADYSVTSVMPIEKASYVHVDVDLTIE
jgi:hypothetical protein